MRHVCNHRRAPISGGHNEAHQRIRPPCYTWAGRRSPPTIDTPTNVDVAPMGGRGIISYVAPFPCRPAPTPAYLAGRIRCLCVIAAPSLACNWATDHIATNVSGWRKGVRHIKSALPKGRLSKQRTGERAIRPRCITGSVYEMAHGAGFRC